MCHIFYYYLSNKQHLRFHPKQPDSEFRYWSLRSGSGSGNLTVAHRLLGFLTSHNLPAPPCMNLTARLFFKCAGALRKDRARHAEKTQTPHFAESTDPPRRNQQIAASVNIWSCVNAPLSVSLDHSAHIRMNGSGERLFVLFLCLRPHR